jgi:hypothetical protein
MVSPLLMAAKMQSNSCPLLKQKGHICDGMMHIYIMQQQALKQAAGKSQGPVFNAAATKCPVECIMASSTQQLRAASAVALASLSEAKAPLAISRISFVSVGRSSHTDRGPPAFELPA